VTAPANDEKTTGKKAGDASSYFPSIEKRYGRPIAEWKQMVRESPLSGHMQLVNWLKTEHGLGHGHANAIVAHTLKEDAGGR
jgi:hypothetical protein